MADGEDLPIKHGVEGCNLVYSHCRHLEQLSDIVHDADTCPALVLPLAEIEKRNDGGFLVLRWVMRDDFLCSLHVFRVELKWNL